MIKIAYRLDLKVMVAVVMAALCCVTFGPVAGAHGPGDQMVSSAKRLVFTLDAEQKKKALFEWGADRRKGWNFVPDKFIQPEKKRAGLCLKDMTFVQRIHVRNLLNSALSQMGYKQTLLTMTLESILHDMENKNPIRDPELYYVSIFGKPSRTGTWGWRYEGHHLSLNISVVKGHMFSVTPSFFGSNPGKVPSGKYEGLQVLRAEEVLARQLVNSLDEGQKKLAIIATKAPRDIITGSSREVDKSKFNPVKGIPFDKLNKEQQAQLVKVVRTYTKKYRPQILKEIDSRKKLESGKGFYFAWAGGTKVGEGHYYRIQTPDFLFEFDNTQNGANHVHAVWRDFDGDFGEDLLKRHYEQDPHHHPKDEKKKSE